MKDRRKEITGILIIAISIFVLVSIVGYVPYEEPHISPTISVQNPMGILGVFVSHFLVKLALGYVSIILPILGILWGWWILGKKKLKILRKNTIFVLLGVLLLSISLGIVGIINHSSSIHSYLTAGLTGNIIANFLVDFLGIMGSIILTIAAWILLLHTYFSWNIYDLFNKIIGTKYQSWKKRRNSIREKEKHTKNLLSKIEAHNLDADKAQNYQMSSKSDIVEKTVRKEKQESFFSKFKGTEKLKDIPNELSGDEVQVDSKSKISEVRKIDDEKIEVGEIVQEKEVILDEQKDRTAPKKEYQLPSTDFLKGPKIKDFSISKDELIERARFFNTIPIYIWS